MWRALRSGHGAHGFKFRPRGFESRRPQSVLELAAGFLPCPENPVPDWCPFGAAWRSAIAVKRLSDWRYRSCGPSLSGS